MNYYFSGMLALSLNPPIRITIKSKSAFIPKSPHVNSHIRHIAARQSSRLFILFKIL